MAALTQKQINIYKLILMNVHRYVQKAVLGKEKSSATRKVSSTLDQANKH